MIVCLCRVATDRDIAEAIDEGARTVDDIGDRCGAGTGCGSCREFIHGMIDEAGAACDGCDDCPGGVIAPQRTIRRGRDVAA